MTTQINRWTTALEPISAGWKLPPVALAERDEIVVEIRAPIHDSVSGTSDPNGATERVFRLLGPRRS